MTYNMTLLQESTTIFELVTYANTSTGDIFLSLFTWAFFFILLMVMKRWEFDSALLTSSILSFIIAMLYNYLELIPFVIPLAFLIIAAMTSFYTFVIKK